MSKEWGKKQVRFNMPESIIFEALSVASGYSINEIKELLINLGDIGDVAEYVLINIKQKKLGDILC